MFSNLRWFQGNKIKIMKPPFLKDQDASVMQTSAMNIPNQATAENETQVCKLRLSNIPIIFLKTRRFGARIFLKLEHRLESAA